MPDEWPEAEVRSMAACLAACWYDTTFVYGQIYAEGDLAARQPWLVMARTALAHIPYLERARWDAMLDAEIGA